MTAVLETTPDIRAPDVRAPDVREGVDRETIETVHAMAGKYKYGWETEIETDYAPKGLNEDIVRLISGKNGEPDWLLDWRLAAYRRWLKMEEPRWAMVSYPEIDYQDQYYYATPKSMAKKPKSLDEVDPKLLATYAKLGIPLKEQMLLAGVEGEAEPRKVAVDAVFDSVSVGTTFKAELARAGVIFCSISEAVREHPELVKQYLGSVVPPTDNFFATLNSAVFSDGSFVYIPKGTRCPMELDEKPANFGPARNMGFVSRFATKPSFEAPVKSSDTCRPGKLSCPLDPNSRQFSITASAPFSAAISACTVRSPT